MNTKHTDFALWACFVVLLLMGVAASIYNEFNPSFKGLTLLSGFATYIIALLTVVYVITTRGQLRIMNRQLSEMTRDRELQAQPLPWPIEVRVYSERPKLFTGPDHPNRPITLIRHHAEAKLRNLGANTAISVDISAHLEIPGDNEPTRWSCASCRAEVIEDKHEYPDKKGEKNSFLFPMDKDALVLTRLLSDQVGELPLLHLVIHYRNILGAYFRLRRYYRIYPQKETQDTVKTWLERVHNLPIRHKETFDLLEQMNANHDSRANALFEELKNKCKDSIDEERVEYDLWSIPGTGDVTNISAEEYEKEVATIGYGMRIDGRYKCPAARKKNN